MDLSGVQISLKNIRLYYEARMRLVKEQYHLTLFEVEIIAFLYDHCDMNTASTITEYRRMPKANVSKAVGNLMRLGYLDANRDEEDHRKIHLVLTTKAAPIIHDIAKAQSDFAAKLFAGFTKREIVQCIRLFDRIGNNVLEGLTDIALPASEEME